MSIWGKIAGAAAGLALGGPLGAIVGAVAGHYALDRDSVTEAPEKDIAFTIGLIALGAKMAKADGVVTGEEVAAFRRVVIVAESDIAHVERVFNLAKRDVAGFEAYAGQLARLFGQRAAILEDVVDGLFHIAQADGALHAAEQDFLAKVTKRFGFSDADFARISARHVPPEDSDPYVVLGVTRDFGEEEIKRHYRKLVRETHPDRLIARGVPEEFVVIANDRLAHINAAYDRVKMERGFA